MNGVSLSGPRPGLPAVAVLRLETGRPLQAMVASPAPLAALLPDVLARYGLMKEAPPDRAAAGPPGAALDLFA